MDIRSSVGFEFIMGKTEGKPSIHKFDARQAKAHPQPTRKNTLAKNPIKSKPPRPTPEECHRATSSLAYLHPHIVNRNDERRATLLESCGLRDSITDAVISTMLSQNTTDKNAKRAFGDLKRTFSDWDSVAECEDVTLIENAIKVAGLAKTRAERIRTLLRTIKKERGRASLDYLRFLSDEETKTELSRFKGLGPKTISCVLLFALGRPEFPVDTHVLRISRKLGWVPSDATRESAYEHLNAVVPPEVKMDLHCLLVTHGKHCHGCAANGRPQFPPKDGTKLDCPFKKVMKAHPVKKEDAPDIVESGMTKAIVPDVVESSMSIPDVVESRTKKEIVLNAAKSIKKKRVLRNNAKSNTTQVVVKTEEVTVVTIKGVKNIVKAKQGFW